MSNNLRSFKQSQTDLSTSSSSPLRHGSTASTSSSVYSAYSNSFAPSRTSTVSSNVSTGSSPVSLGHKRGKSELSTMAPAAAAVEWSAADSSPSAAETYGQIRRSLRPLQQAPNASPPAKQPQTSFRHARSHTVDDTQYRKEPRPLTPEPRAMHLQENEPLSPLSKLDRDSCPPQTPPHGKSPRSPQTRPHHSHSVSTPHTPIVTATLTAPELETFQKSSTGHLRTLSKIAQSGESEEFSIGTTAPTVVGLQGRRRLKRSGANGHNRRKNTSAWAAGNWMDKQRQFLQAYEYLCHIGEAKEWIEDVIQKPIPPIVQLEEALRDGVTLAEIVQALYPNRTVRIFRHPKLQYRHSDNIALFFRFLDEVELPELFRFELIDLYEKKNIPKVIHCIHALSWLLFKKGIVEFRIGNLVGQLEFEHHELEQTQRGLDKSGVSMPSFSGMGASFGAEPEPEPEPEETEEERIERELGEHEAYITDFQAQLRGAMLRLRLTNVMNELWDVEHLIVDLQSRIRGDFARQIADYRLSMRRFAVNLQAISRGFIVRWRYRNNQNWWKEKESDIVKLQSLVRAARVRDEAKYLQTRMRREESGIKSIQAAIRGALRRKQVFEDREETLDAENEIQSLQSAIRGMLTRQSMAQKRTLLDRETSSITFLQAGARAIAARARQASQKEALAKRKDKWIVLQSTYRGAAVRENLKTLRSQLAQHGPSILELQSRLRANSVRENLKTLRIELRKHTPTILELQSRLRAKFVREDLKALRSHLGRHVPAILDIQSRLRATFVRENLKVLRSQLAEHTPTILELQSRLRANFVREYLEAQRNSLAKHETSILNLQSMIRGFLLRKQWNADLQALKKQTPRLISLQALARAAILRINVGGILSELEENYDEIVQLQALTRGMLVRLDVGQVLMDLEAEEDIITDLQARIRGSIIRTRFEEKRRYFLENMEKVIKVQSIVRGKIQGQAYKSLTSGKNPPVGTVKGFVHLLNDSDFDFDEEIEFERLRKTVVQQVRQNELADQYITQLDIKIALLVKNKITLDEVVKHQKHFGGHVGSLLPNTDISSKDPFDLKALNKTSRRKLEQYQVLFFLLQTQPQYLAKLFRRLRELNTSEKEYEKIKHWMMGLFGYSQKRREEYYLIKLIVRSIKEEVESFTSLQDYMRCNSFWNKLFAAYIKSPRDRKFLRDVLGPVVKESIIDNPDLDLESDPMHIYRATITNEELRTGRRSRRRPDVPREEAIRDPETRAIFIQNLQDLRDIADQLFTAIEDFLYRMPFGIRYIAKQMYEYLLSQFADEGPGFILQVVGQWVWKSYFQPALVEPERHGIVDRGLNQEQKRNLAEVVKVLNQVASGRLFGGENIYLQPLNTYVGESIQRLGHTWANCEYYLSSQSSFQVVLTPQ